MRDVPGPSTSNSVSGDVVGPLTQIGVVHGDVNLVTGAPVKTRYLETVRRIAPPKLIGRETELADLADFCRTSPTPYRWVRAKAWSGKSALLSTFALDPPPGVRIVSFFVTARLAAQDNRGAFIESVLEQLLAILGQPVPPLLSESTREAHLLGLLADAARACRDRGEHFVLLVDGLDEDRGVTTGPDAHSIAALLPIDPPAGMRVIVAGRPAPPIPSDVPDHHSLRARDIVQPLATSPAAQAKRSAMEQEVKRLLHGTRNEQALLGLLTAAGGGLAAADLAELTGWSTWEVDDHLRTVTGRSFSRRTSHYRPGASPDVYLLGHEELHVTAVDMLGPTRLGEYRDLVHAWARTYRDRRWPADTPEYLLRGYFAMLGANADLDGMLAYGTDPARHDLLLEVTGGEATALAEITATQQVLLARQVPDLVAMSRLAVHRDRLTGRNQWLPHNLPSLWAGIGHVDRAEALAGSFAVGRERDRALRATVEAVIRLGDLDSAVDLASSIGDAGYHGDALEAVVTASVECGDTDRARTLVRQAEGTYPLIEDSYRQGRAMAALVRSTIELDDLRHAENLAGLIVNRRFRGEALHAVVKALVEFGQLDRAAELGRSIEDSRSRGRALQAVVEARFPHAEALAREITDSAAQGRALDTVVRHLVERGDHQRASAVAELITDTARRGLTLIRVAGHASSDRVVTTALSTTDATDPGQSLTSAVRGVITTDDPGEEAEFLARSTMGAPIAEMNAGRTVLAAVYAAIALGDLDRADALTAFITEVRHRSRALHALTEAAVRLGATDLVSGFLDRAAALIDFTGDPVRHGQALAWALRAAIAANDPDRVGRLFARAEASALASSDATRQSWALRAVVQAGIAVGEAERVRHLPDLIPIPAYQHEALIWLTRVAAHEGDLARAEALTESISMPAYRGQAVAAVVAAATAHGDVKRAEQVIQRATAVARRAADVARQSKVLRSIVNEVVRLGDLEQAQELASSIADARHRSKAWVSLFRAVRGRDPERASVLFDKAKTTALSITDTHLRGRAIEGLASALCREGDIAEAEALAYSIADAGARSAAMSTIGAAAFRFRTRARQSTPERDDQAVASLVHVTVSEGDRDREMEWVHSISDPHYRSHVLQSMAAAVIEAGDLDRVAGLVAAMPLASRQRLTIAKLIRAVIARGDLERAAELVAGGAEAGHQELAAELTVEIAVATGDFQRAEALVRSTVVRHSRADVMSRVARAVIEAGDLDRGEELALWLMENGHSARHVESLIRSMVAGDDLDRAARLLDRAVAEARSIGMAGPRGVALAGVVGVVDAFGDHDRAVELAHSIETPKDRANALGNIAWASLASGDADRAGAITDSIVTAEQPTNAVSLVGRLQRGPGRRLLARGLAAEGWTSYIGVLCRMAPEALPVMIGELTAALRTEVPD